MESLLLTYIQKCPDFMISNLGKVSIEMVECIAETEQNLFPNKTTIKLIPKDHWDEMRIIPVSKSQFTFYIFEN